VAGPAVHDLDTYAGDTWAQTFRFLTDGSPVDLTTASVEAWARTIDGAVTELAVAVDGPAGEVTLGHPHGGFERGAYEYDVEVTQSGVVRTWVRGTLVAERDVTNDP
jgi:hypothetical protein